MILKIFKGFEQFGDHYPSEAVKYAMEHRDEAIPELLEILEYTLTYVEKLSKDVGYLVHFPSVYMLAYFRETKAFDYIIRIASLPDEQAYNLLGDTITEDFGRILASVCDGNIEPIKGIIENSSLDEYVRNQALASLLILLNDGVVSREQLVFYFKRLFNGGLEVDYSLVWDSLPRTCSLIHPKGLGDDIRKAVADNKVMGVIAGLDYMERQLQRPIKEVLDELKENQSYSLITERDVYSLERWVGAYSNDDFDDDFGGDFNDGFDDDFDDDFEEAYIDDLNDEKIPLNIPFRRESRVGRNDPCPCGSGKKYKKCCGKLG